MHTDILDYRMATAILEHPDFAVDWAEVQTCLEGLTPDLIIDVHLDISRRLIGAGKRPPVGAQTAVNAVIRSRLEDEFGWEGQPRLFRSDAPGLADWTMDFYKQGVGIEVAFNNASYFPWIFTRLNVAGESELVITEHRVKVGITICAMSDAKSWGSMDPSVGVFEKVSLWLQVMRPILPVPMALIGLSTAGWATAPPIFGKRWWESPQGAALLRT